MFFFTLWYDACWCRGRVYGKLEWWMHGWWTKRNQAMRKVDRCAEHDAGLSPQFAAHLYYIDLAQSRMLHHTYITRKNSALLAAAYWISLIIHQPAMMYDDRTKYLVRLCTLRSLYSIYLVILVATCMVIGVTTLVAGMESGIVRCDYIHVPRARTRPAIETCAREVFRSRSWLHLSSLCCEKEIDQA